MKVIQIDWRHFMRKISSVLTLILVVCLTIGGVSAAWVYATGSPEDIFANIGIEFPEWEFGYTVSFINNGELLLKDNPDYKDKNPLRWQPGTELVLMKSTGFGITNVLNEVALAAATEADETMGSDYIFSHWMNAGSTRVDVIPADNTENIILYPSFVGLYTATFVDQNGNVVSWTTFTEGQKTLPADEIPPVPELEDTGIFTFVGSWEDYTLNDADITIYPRYEITSTNSAFDLIPVDSDADGDTDYYILDVVSNTGADITVPGYINGCPILIVKDLTSGNASKNIVNIIILEGVEELTSTGSTGAAKLETVALPHSLKRITADNLFGNGSKQIAITYAGTVEEFCQIQKIDGWDNGLTNGTTITCTDGVINCQGKNSWRYNGSSIDINPNEYTP